MKGMWMTREKDIILYSFLTFPSPSFRSARRAPLREGRTKEGWDRKVSDKEKLFIDLLVGRSYRLLTRSLHSSYVMWEGREEPA